MSAPKRKFKPTQKSFKGQPKIQPTVRTVLGPTNVKVVQNPSETTRTTPDMKSELKQIEYKQRFQGTPSNVSTTIKRRINKLGNIGENQNKATKKKKLESLEQKF